MNVEKLLYLSPYVLNDKNKIFVFEDADCMTNILFKRKSPTIEQNDAGTCIKDTDKKCSERISKYVGHKRQKNMTIKQLRMMIDGINEGDGRIIVMTSNHIDKFDNALMRPGRFDLKINLNFLNVRNIIEFINEYFNIDLKFEEYREQLTNVKITGADLMSLCEKNLDNYTTILLKIV